MNLKVTLTALLSAGLVTAATAQQLPRLLAQSYYSFDGTNYIPMDSVHYSYGGTRGSSPQPFNNVTDLYENSYDQADSLSYSGGSWSTFARTTKTYSGNNLDTRLMEKYSSSAWSNSKKVTVDYVSTKPDTSRWQTWSTNGSGSWRDEAKIGYTWNGTNVTTVTRIAYKYGGGGSSGWRNDYNHSFTYSGSNIASQTIQTWDNTNSVWVNSSKKDITYGGNGPLKFENRNWSVGNNSFLLNDRGTYTYTGSQLTTLLEQYTTDNGSTWDNSKQYTYYYNGSSTRPDTMMEQTWDPFSNLWNNTRKYAYQYNAYGQVTSIITLSWNNAWLATSSDDMTNYYYDLHPTSVATTKGQDNNIALYPVPAGNNLKVQVGTQIGQVLHYSLTGVDGAVVKTWTAMNTGLAQDVNISELPAGNYFMVVHDGQNVSTKQFTVVK